MLALFETKELPQLWLSLGSGNNPSHEATLTHRVAKLLHKAGALYALARSNGKWLAKFQDLLQVQKALDALNQELDLTNEMLFSCPVYLHFRAAYLSCAQASQTDAQRFLFLETTLNRMPPGDLLADAATVAPSAALNLQRESLIRKELYLALQHNKLHLLYQPLVDLNSGALVSAEALLRIADSSLGPDDFIPVAESIGVINTLGSLAFAKANACKASLTAAGLPSPTFNIAVNVSAAQLGLASFQKLLKDAINCQAPLELEITESLSLSKESQAVLTTLEELGYPLTMDDFGAGASSLVQLLQSPIGKVKLDKSLLQLTAQQPEQLKNLVAIAHAQGCRVVIEGIENKEDLTLAQRAGADYGQGYLFDRPLTEPVLTHRLSQQFCLQKLLWVAKK